MELVGIELSRVVHLRQVYRPAGGLYLPEAFGKIAQRYSFVKLPEDLTRDSHVFSIGKFQDVQINEFGIYNDGVIATAKGDSDIVEAFLNDVFEWSFAEFGIVPTVNDKPEFHYESQVVVKCQRDIAALVTPANDASNIISAALSAANNIAYMPTGAIFENDIAAVTSKRRPARFTLERRVGTPLAENLFFSNAPLTTQQHLSLLQALDEIPLKKGVAR